MSEEKSYGFSAEKKAEVKKESPKVQKRTEASAPRPKKEEVKEIKKEPAPTPAPAPEVKAEPQKVQFGIDRLRAKKARRQGWCRLFVPS